MHFHTCVPTGMKTGVSTSPCGKIILPTRPFVTLHSDKILKINGLVIVMDILQNV